MVQAEEQAQEKKHAKELKKSQKGPGRVSRRKEHREEELLARARRNYAKDVEEVRKQKEKATVPPLRSSNPTLTCRASRARRGLERGTINP